MLQCGMKLQEIERFRKGIIGYGSDPLAMIPFLWEWPAYDDIQKMRFTETARCNPS